MTKYLLTLVLLTGCAYEPPTLKNGDPLPESDAIAQYSAGYVLWRFHDKEFGNVCYVLSGTSLSCVKTDSIK